MSGLLTFLCRRYDAYLIMAKEIHKTAVERRKILNTQANSGSTMCRGAEIEAIAL